METEEPINGQIELIVYSSKIYWLKVNQEDGSEPELLRVQFPEDGPQEGQGQKGQGQGGREI